MAHSLFLKLFLRLWVNLDAVFPRRLRIEFAWFYKIKDITSIVIWGRSSHLNRKDNNKPKKWQSIILVLTRQSFWRVRLDSIYKYPFQWWVSRKLRPGQITTNLIVPMIVSYFLFLMNLRGLKCADLTVFAR